MSRYDFSLPYSSACIFSNDSGFSDLIDHLQWLCWIYIYLGIKFSCYIFDYYSLFGIVKFVNLNKNSWFFRQLTWFYLVVLLYYLYSLIFFIIAFFTYLPKIDYQVYSGAIVLKQWYYNIWRKLVFRSFVFLIKPSFSRELVCK